MRSTYTLVGALWDGLPAPPLPPAASGSASDVPVAGTPRNLFDLHRCRRRLPTSLLFRIADERALALLAEQLAGCDEVIIDVDSRPTAPGLAPQRFFERRLRQACGRLHDLLPSAHILLADRRAA